MFVNKVLLALCEGVVLAFILSPAILFAESLPVKCSIAFFEPSKDKSFAKIAVKFNQPVKGFSYKDLSLQKAVVNDFEKISSGDSNYASLFVFRLDGRFPRSAQTVVSSVMVPRGVVRSAKTGRTNSQCGPFKIQLVKYSETPTPIETVEPDRSETPTVFPTDTPETPEMTATNTSTPTETASIAAVTETATNTATVSSTPTSAVISVSRTNTPTATRTFTATKTATVSKTITPIATATITKTTTRTPTSTNTPISTFTSTVTSTASATRTSTPTYSPTFTKTQIPTIPTGTATSTPTATGVGAACSSALSSSVNTLPIFPGAEGFGINTTAGSGRHLAFPCAKIFKITNLNDSGEGSLRQCVEAVGARTCIFEVGGVIWSTKALRITNPYLTIAGQTAPSPGIVIRGAGISTEASNVFIQHIKVRPGDDIRAACCLTSSCSATEAKFCTQDPGSRDGVNTYATGAAINNVVYDHMSISWALDEGWSINPDKADISNITLSNSIIDSGLDMSIHPEASNPLDPGHSKAVLIKGLKNVNNLSFHKNLLTHNAERNIRIGSSVSMEYINNVVYDWGRGKGVGRLIEATNSISAKHTFDLIGNIYIPGPDTFCPETQYRAELCSTVPGGIDTPEQRAKMHYILRIGSGISGGLSALSRYYIYDNLGTTRAGGDQWNVVDRGFFTSNTASALIYPQVKANSPVATSGSVIPLDTDSAYAHVITNAGARPYERDVVDQNAIGDLITLSGRIINCVADDGSERCKKNAGGWPEYSAASRALSIPENPFNDSDGDGYTNLENWLQSF